MAKNGRYGYQDSPHPDWQGLTAKQHGYVSRPQLLAIGLKAASIRHLITAGRLIPVHAGVYAVGYVDRTPLARAFAAVLACGSDAVLSHGSAATLWGFQKRWDLPFEVTVRTSHRHRPGIKIHRSRTLGPEDLDCQLAVPVTSPARTVLDITPRLSDKRLTRVVNDGRYTRLLHLDDLADVLQRNPNHPGITRLKPFLEGPTGITRSSLEDRFLRFARRYGLPEPQTNVPLLGYVVDVLFPIERVIVEVDGWDSHRFKTSFESDRKRDTVMLSAGYQTVRTTDERLRRDAEAEARDLHKILEARRSTLTLLSKSLARIPATGAPTAERPAS